MRSAHAAQSRPRALRPSSGHPNRRIHNWLAYDSLDRLLVAHRARFSGVLYDLGCGSSPYRDWFLGCTDVDAYVGVDWPDSLYQSAPDVIADLNGSIPVADAVADSLVALSVLEHLREPRTMLAEAFRLLKPGGELVLQVPWQWWIHEAPHDYYRYSPFALRDLLTHAGFESIEVVPQSGAFSMLALKTNYLSLRLVRGPRALRMLQMLALAPVWLLAQMLAPLLDRLDSDWELEAPGYFVTARKPGARQPGARQPGARKSGLAST